MVKIRIIDLITEYSYSTIREILYKGFVMKIWQDKIEGTFENLVLDFKKYEAILFSPDLENDSIKLNKKLEYMPSIPGSLGEHTHLRLVDAKKDGYRNYWFNLIGTTFRMYSNSYSEGGQGIIHGCGCTTIDRNSKLLVFEVIALPINLMKSEIAIKARISKITS